VQIILLLHYLRLIIYKRVLSSALLNTPKDLKGRREENSILGARRI